MPLKWNDIFKRRSSEPEPSPVAPDDVPPEVLELVQAGKRIEAIKLYLRLTGVGLKESKRVIDALWDTLHPR